MNDYKATAKTSYTKEYRTLLEKLLEIQVRLTEIKGDKKLQAKLETLIDKLLFYFNKQVDKTIEIHKQYDSRWGNDETDDNSTSN
jgi:hypothetical protein